MFNFVDVTNVQINGTNISWQPIEKCSKLKFIYDIELYSSGVNVIQDITNITSYKINPSKLTYCGKNSIFITPKIVNKSKIEWTGNKTKNDFNLSLPGE